MKTSFVMWDKSDPRFTQIQMEPTEVADPLKSWASGIRIEDTPEDRFSGLVSKKRLRASSVGTSGS